IEGRALNVGKYTDVEFRRAEQVFFDLVRELVRHPLDFLMVTGELFLSYTRARARIDRSLTSSNKSRRCMLRRCLPRLFEAARHLGSRKWQWRVRFPKTRTSAWFSSWLMTGLRL